MKKLLLKSLLLLCALVVGSGSVWADTKITDKANIVAGTRYYIGATTSSTDYYLQLPASTGNLGTAITSSGSATVFIFEAVENKTNVYKIKIADTSNYLATMSTTNGYMTFGTTAAEYTASNQSNKLRLSNNSRSIQKNNSGTRFGSYANTQTDIWLIEAPSASVVAKPTISGLESFLTSTQVSISCATTGATIQYSTNGGTSWNNYSTPFTLTETTTVQAKATKSGLTDSQTASKTFTKTTEKTVAEALTAIEALEDNGTISGYYVKGIVSTAGTVNSGKITYSISDDGTTTSELKVYSGKGLNDAVFTSNDDIQLGDKVTVYGTVKKYVNGTNTTLEFDSGNYLYSIVKKPTFSPAGGAVAAGSKVTISSTLDGATIYYTTDGTTPTTVSTVYSSPITINVATTIKAIAVKDGYPESSVAEATYTIAEPCATPAFSVAAGAYSAAQSVEITCATDDATIHYTLDGTEPTASSTTYSSAISISTDKTIKAIAVKDGYANSDIAEASYTFYAALPFSYDENGLGTLPIGLSQSGLTGKYDSSPKMKFDNTDDYLVLKINEVPGTLTFDIKGNGSGSDPWAGTFTVQTSADGETYTNLKSYTSLSSKQSESFANELASNVRYIKWIYTAKTTGNVALGNIELTSTVAFTPAKEYTTLTSAKNLDFTSVSSDLKAYIATEISEGKVQMTQVNKVPAGTGLVLKATTPGSAVNVPVFDGTSPDDVSGNKMDGSATETTAVAANAGYILSSGIFQPSSGGTLPAGKAYLAIAVSSARTLEMSFDESDVTAISEVTNTNRTNNTNEYFDLQGRKVAQPTKGLYILNGKKYIVK